MAQLSRVLRNVEGGRLAFWCSGCDMAHMVSIGSGTGPRWGYNGNAERPTFTPSILVQWTQGEPSATDEAIRRKIASGEIKQRLVAKVCHSFVTDGRIQYLGDCTHALAGTTIDLPAWPED